MMCLLPAGDFSTAVGWSVVMEISLAFLYYTNTLVGL